MSIVKRYGWIRDRPDLRDFPYVVPAEILVHLPPKIDLRNQYQFPPVYSQGNLNSCSANAIAAAVEFDLIKQHQKRVFIPSRLFLYYNERAMEGTVASDCGGQIRDGIKSEAKQGDCPEKLWQYDVTKFSIKPPQRCYNNALKYKTVNYQRLSQDLNQFKRCLVSGYPFVCGIIIYESFEGKEVEKTGQASMPAPGEKAIGGHAVMAVGYDDSDQRFIMRNSWGDSWGTKGYFTIPYAYLLNHTLSSDFWTIKVVS